MRNGGYGHNSWGTAVQEGGFIVELVLATTGGGAAVLACSAS